MRRGELRWYTFALPDKRRPVLLLSRDAVLPSLNEVIVVPATRTIRGIDTELVLTEDDGMPTACALNFDYVSLARSLGRSESVQRLPDWTKIVGARSSALCSSLAASRPTHSVAREFSLPPRVGQHRTRTLARFCSDSRTRTLDPAVNSRLLYQLS